MFIYKYTYLSTYLSTFIVLCFSFHVVFMLICTRNKIISYAYLDDPGYKFRQFYASNGKMETK